MFDVGAGDFVDVTPPILGEGDGDFVEEMVDAGDGLIVGIGDGEGLGCGLLFGKPFVAIERILYAPVPSGYLPTDTFSPGSSMY